jgi:hypothetical protein
MKFNLATGAATGHLCGAIVTYAVAVGADGRIRLHLGPQAAAEI